MKMKNSAKMLGITTLLLASILSGCGQNQNASSTTGQNQGSDQQQKAPDAGKADVDGRLRLNLKTEPPSLDPPKGTDGVSVAVVNSIMEGLTRLDDKHMPQPGMAEKWEVNQDGQKYTFHLRSSKWSNGDTVTAQDFEFAWKRALDPKLAYPYAYLAYCIEGAEAYNSGKGSADQVKVTAIDEKTLEVTLTSPTGYFLSLVTTPTFMPVNKKAVESNPNWFAEASTVVSNGPFKLSGWVHDQSIKVDKNDGYWDKDSVKLAGIDWVMVNDENTQYQMFMTNQVDAIESVPNDMKKKLLDSGEAKYTPQVAIYYYRMNTAMPPFQNTNIRKAFALAINRQLLIDKVANGKQMPALSYVPFGLKEPDGRDFRDVGGNFVKDNDIEQAKALLKKGMEEEGYTTLPPITMSYNTDDMHKAIAQALQEMFMKNLGVEVKLENKEWKVFLQEQRASQLQFSRSLINADYADPVYYLEAFQSENPGNRVHFSNPAYDDLIAKIKNEPDEKKRFALMHEAEKMYMDNIPIVPIYFNTLIFMEQPKVKGIIRHPVGSLEYKWAQIEK